MPMPTESGVFPSTEIGGTSFQNLSDNLLTIVRTRAIIIRTDISHQLAHEEPKMSTVTVKISSKNFAKGVSYAKKFGGKFNPTTKTWEIPADRPELGNLGAYYLIRVERQAVQESEDSMMGIDSAEYWQNLK